MTERNIGNITPQEAQEQVVAALTFAHDSGAQSFDNRSQHRAVDGQLLSSVATVYGSEPTTLKSQSGVEGSVTEAKVQYASSGNYAAKLTIKHDSAIERLMPGYLSDATVERTGYGVHTFKPGEHSVKAASLIASLAAKHVARDAAEYTDRIMKKAEAARSAHEVYTEKIAVSDQTPDVEPVKARTT